MKKYLILFLVILTYSAVVFGGATTVVRPTSIKQVAGYPAGTAWDLHYTNPGVAGEAADTTIWGPVWNLNNDFKERPVAMNFLYKARADDYTTKDDIYDSVLVEGKYMPLSGGGWTQPEDSARLIETPNRQAKWRPRSYLTTGPEASKYWFRIAEPIQWNAQDSLFGCYGTVYIPSLVSELRIRSFPATGGDSLRDVHYRVVFYK